MSKLSYISLVAAVTALSVSLVGCGSSDSKPAATDKKDATAKSSEGYPKMEIKFSHVASDKTPKGEAANKFKKVVEEKSGGNIKVKVFPSGQLYGDNDEVEALQANNVQIIAPAASKLAGFDKSFQLFDMPFLFKDEAHIVKFEDGDGGKQLLSKVENNKMKGLAFWPNGFKSITTNKTQVTKPDDLKGLKIRTHGGALINDVYSQLGAASTKVAFNEVYQALQLGTVDGQENSLVNIQTEKYSEVQKYLTLTNHARSEYVVVANQDWWKGLDKKTQDLLTEAMKEATQTARDEEKKLEDAALDSFKKGGKMQITELNADQRKAFLDALKPVSDKWGKEIDANILKAVDAAGK